MKQGTVKWFNTSKGYGFIAGDDGKDYFVHYTGITKEGFKSLRVNKKVTFNVIEKDGKEYAVDVTEE